MNQALFHTDTRVATETALVAAVLLHLAALFLVPAGSAPEPVLLPPPAEIFFDFRDAPPDIPAAPAAVARPPMPDPFNIDDFTVHREASVDETIRDTRVEILNPNDVVLRRADLFAPRETGGVGSDRFTTWSEDPAPRRLVQPEYPALARDAGIEGRVVAEAVIDEEGRVTEARIVRSPSPVFDEPVLRALRASLFYPAKQRDKPVRSFIRVPYEFYLR